MYTKVQIINLGLGKISSSLISRIDPPQSSLERFCADGYENWKRTEIAKRRWVFAIDDEVALPMIEERDGSEFRYVYQLPTDCLRPKRHPPRRRWTRPCGRVCVIFSARMAWCPTANPAP